MLVNSNLLLSDGAKNGYAIGSYNINNLEWTRFILEACNKDNSPVILAVSISSVKYFGSYKIVYNMVKTLINELNIKVPVVLHLDHAKTFEECKEAIDSGFTSVMIDGSSLPFEENALLTSKVVNYAHERDVSVEAEIGSFEEESLSDSNLCYEFISMTNVDSLAPSIGNKHGIYEKEVNIDFKLLGEICKTCKIPLVLHGASLLDENKINTAIFCGVSKININTDLMLAWSNAVKAFLKENPLAYDPRSIISAGKDALIKMVHEKNKLFSGKNRG